MKDYGGLHDDNSQDDRYDHIKFRTADAPPGPRRV